MQCECWWRWGLGLRHLLLMERHRCTWRHGTGMYVAVVKTLVELGADKEAAG
jgi:hypothetical protein